MIVENDGWDSCAKSCGSGNQCFGDAGRDGAQAGGTGAAEAGEGVDDAPDGAEEAEFLENHGPGDDGEHQQKQQNAAGDPAGLRKNVSDIGDEKRGEQKNDIPLSERR